MYGYPLKFALAETRRGELTITFPLGIILSQKMFLFLLNCLSKGKKRVFEKFQKFVIFYQEHVFCQKFCSKKLFFSLKCSSFLLKLNAENQLIILAVKFEIHVFEFFLYGVYMAVALSKL